MTSDLSSTLEVCIDNVALYKLTCRPTLLYSWASVPAAYRFGKAGAGGVKPASGTEPTEDEASRGMAGPLQGPVAIAAIPSSLEPVSLAVHPHACGAQWFHLHPTIAWHGCHHSQPNYLGRLATVCIPLA